MPTFSIVFRVGVEREQSRLQFNCRWWEPTEMYSVICYGIVSDRTMESNGASKLGKEWRHKDHHRRHHCQAVNPRLQWWNGDIRAFVSSQISRTLLSTAKFWILAVLWKYLEKKISKFSNKRLTFLTILTNAHNPSIHLFSTSASSWVQGHRRLLEPLPEIWGRKAGWNPSQATTHIHIYTFRHFRVLTIDLTCIFSDFWKKPEKLKRNHVNTGRTWKGLKPSPR